MPIKCHPCSCCICLQSGTIFFFILLFICVCMGSGQPLLQMIFHFLAKVVVDVSCSKGICMQLVCTLYDSLNCNK